MVDQSLPTGEIVRPMERGQVTIPAGLRKKLAITPETPLNVFEWRGMVVMVPVEFKFKIRKRAAADWLKDAPEKYLAKVRYNPLEELWAKMARRAQG